MVAPPRDEQTHVRTHLAALRQERGIRQTEMAAAIGVSPTTYRRLERGQMSNPPLRYLTNAAILLRVDLEDVIEDEWREWLVVDDLTASEPPDPRRLWRKRRDLLDGA